jgi:hypothetical protein
MRLKNLVGINRTKSFFHFTKVSPQRADTHLSITMSFIFKKDNVDVPRRSKYFLKSCTAGLFTSFAKQITTHQEYSSL